MTPLPELDTSLSRARMLFSMLSVPKLRRGLGALLAGEGASEDPSVHGPLSRLDWLPTGRADGPGDVEAVREITEALSLLRSDRAILEVGRLDGIPAGSEESRALCSRIARLVFERIGPERTLSEPELNAAIAMVAQDVALVRRDAVDAGALERSADGAAYRLAPRG